MKSSSISELTGPVRDWSVLVTPAYFASMGLEHVLLKRRARTVGPSPADYTRDDTRASLSMGVASLAVPPQHDEGQPLRWLAADNRPPPPDRERTLPLLL